MKDGRAVIGPMEGLTNLLEGIRWEAELFWDILKAWPTCLRGLDWRSSCSETYGGLADMYKGVGWEADVLWDL